MRENGQLSPSGVWIADNFRSNLIIDRYDPVFADMRASKIKHLRSANSEDAITWNIFRSLRQVDPSCWLPALWVEAFPAISKPECSTGSIVKLWESVDPPMGLLATGDEGASEIDVIIESASWVWFIEAKYKSDISLGTTVRPDRDQILRNIDVGSHYAGVRQFFFTLLISDEKRTRLGMEKLKEYAELETLRSKLATHRGDRLINLQGIGHLTWQKTSKVLRHAQANANREDERCYARRALDWMAERKLTDEN